MKSPAARYSLSLAAVAAAVGARALLQPVLSDHLPFITLFAAIPFVAWCCGRGPSLLAMVAGAIAVDYFIVEPVFSFTIDHVEYQAGLVLYVAVCLASIAMFDSLEKARQRSEEERLRLEREILARQAAEKELADREQLLRTTFASIGDAVLTTDGKGNVTYLNAVAEGLTGWTHQEAKGQPLTTVFRIINEDSRRTVENPVEKALREGRVVGLANHTLLIGRDGTERAIDDSAAPIRDDSGAIIGVVLIFRDIGDRRHTEAKLARSAERFQLAAEAVKGIIYEYNFQTGHVERTTGLYEVLGYHPDEVPATAQWWWDQLHPEDRATGKPSMEEAMAAGRNVKSEYRIRHKDGRWLHVVDRAILFKEEDGRPVKMVGCTVDVTEQKQNQEALRYQSDLMKSITDNATTAIFMMDRDSRCTFMNPAAEKMTGFTFSELQGAILHDFIHHHHPDGRPYPMPECPIDRALPELFDVVGHEDTFIRKNGEFFPVLVNAKPIRQNGVAIGTVIEVRDVTQEKQAAELLRERELRFQTMAETLPQIVFTATSEGVVDYVNSRWTEFTGLTLQETNAPNGGGAIHPEDVEQNNRAWEQSLRSGTLFESQFRCRRSDGTYRWMMCRALPLKNSEGQVTKWFGTTTDTDELRQAQEALREADRRKDEFLATLAHELRNPLAPVKNSLALLKLAGDDPMLMEEAVDTLDRQISQMVRLIDDLMDVSRITSNKLDLRKQRAELASIVHHAVEANRPLCERANHELNVNLPQEPVYLDADPVRLAQVFGNLLTNACKYTPPGGRISLTAERQGSDVLVAVDDNGIGIPPEMLPKVFDLFTQVDRTLERSEGGLGIGLSLVKRLVEMHNGSVTVHSEGQGRGSTFVVRLPIVIERPPVETARDTPQNAVKPKARRILVVDDNQDAAKSLTTLLKIMGNETQTAFDGVEAIEKAMTYRPELILLDIGLPKMNGYDVCRAIREQPWGADVVVVALTGWGQDDDRTKSAEAGFNFHLVKPVDHATLRQLLAEMQPSQV